MAPWVKGPALLQLLHRSQLWIGFNPWPGNIHMPQVWPKKKRKTPDIVKSQNLTT